MDVATVPELQSDYYSLCEQLCLPYLDRCIHLRNVVDVCTEKNLPRLYRLVEIMKVQKAITNAVLHAVTQRETAMSELMKTCAVCSSSEEKEDVGRKQKRCSIDGHLRAALALKDIDRLSLKVLSAIEDWRRHLCKPLPFLVRGENYVLKMLLDAPVLAEAETHVNIYGRDAASMVSFNGCCFSRATFVSAGHITRDHQDRHNPSRASILLHRHQTKVKTEQILSQQRPPRDSRLGPSPLSFLRRTSTFLPPLGLEYESTAAASPLSTITIVSRRQSNSTSGVSPRGPTFSSPVTRSAAAGVSFRVYRSKSSFDNPDEMTLGRKQLENEYALQMELVSELLRLAERGLYMPVLSFTCTAIIQKNEPVTIAKKQQQDVMVNNYKSGLRYLDSVRARFKPYHPDLETVARSLYKNNVASLQVRYLRMWRGRIWLLQSLRRVRLMTEEIVRGFYWTKWCWFLTHRQSRARTTMQIMASCFPRPTTNLVATYGAVSRPMDEMLDEEPHRRRFTETEFAVERMKMMILFAEEFISKFCCLGFSSCGHFAATVVSSTETRARSILEEKMQMQFSAALYFRALAHIKRHMALEYLKYLEQVDSVRYVYLDLVELQNLEANERERIFFVGVGGLEHLCSHAILHLQSLFDNFEGLLEPFGRSHIVVEEKRDMHDKVFPQLIPLLMKTSEIRKLKYLYKTWKRNVTRRRRIKQSTLVVLSNEQSLQQRLRRRYFLRYIRFVFRIARPRKVAIGLLFQIELAHRASRLHLWVLFVTAPRYGRKAKSRAIRSRYDKNVEAISQHSKTILLERSYVQSWLRYVETIARPRRVLRKFLEACSLTQRRLIFDDWKGWTARRVKRRNQLNEICSDLIENTDLMLRQAFMMRWIRFVVVVARPNALVRRFLSTNEMSQRRIVFIPWIQQTNILLRQRQSCAMLCHVSEEAHRRTRYNGWLKWSEHRRERRAELLECCRELLEQTSLKRYASVWMLWCRFALRVAELQTKSNQLLVMSRNIHRRAHYVQWRRFVAKRREMSAMAAEICVRTEAGLQRLFFQRWRRFYHKHCVVPRQAAILERRCVVKTVYPCWTLWAQFVVYRRRFSRQLLHAVMALEGSHIRLQWRHVFNHWKKVSRNRTAQRITSQLCDQSEHALRLERFGTFMSWLRLRKKRMTALSTVLSSTNFSVRSRTFSVWRQTVTKRRLHRQSLFLEAQNEALALLNASTTWRRWTERKVSNRQMAVSALFSNEHSHRLVSFSSWLRWVRSRRLERLTRLRIARRYVLTWKWFTTYKKHIEVVSALERENVISYLKRIHIVPKWIRWVHLRKEHRARVDAFCQLGENLNKRRWFCHWLEQTQRLVRERAEYVVRLKTLVVERANNRSELRRSFSPTGFTTQIGGKSVPVGGSAIGKIRAGYSTAQSSRRVGR